MSTIKHNTNRDASQLLNNWLCGQVSKATSLEGLRSIAMEHSSYQHDADTIMVVAKVWSDYREGRIKPRGYVSKFELQLLMRTSPRFGGNAVALLIEVRRCNPRGSEFTLSPEAVSRLLPEIGRRAFEHARDVLVEAGVVEKVRNFRRDHRGFHDAALYVLTPVREMGEIPAMKVKTSQERARPRAATELPEAPAETVETETVAPYVDETPPSEDITMPAAAVVVTRIKKFMAAVKLDAQQYREHARLIEKHHAAEQAGKKFLLPEEVWEVWKPVFDFPTPMTKTEETRLHNHTEWWGAELSDFERIDFLRMIREPESKDAEPDWKALQEFQKQVAATMVVDSLVVTPKEKFERAPLPEDQWPTMSSADRRRMHEWSEARRLRGETPLSYQNMLAFIHGDEEAKDFLEQEWQEDLRRAA